MTNTTTVLAAVVAVALAPRALRLSWTALRALWLLLRLAWGRAADAAYRVRRSVRRASRPESHNGLADAIASALRK